MNKEYIVKETMELENLGFKKTKRGYRKTIGNLKIRIENGLMTINQDNNKVFYLNSFEKLDLLLSKMFNKGMICNVLY